MPGNSGTGSPISRDPPCGERALLVAAAEDDLPGAEAAAREAAALLGAGDLLAGDAATRDAVLARLAGATWAHFGCHATSDPSEPSGGTLHLPNGETLTVGEISAARPKRARLAFLTACGTARTAERLASEAVHLSSAFLVAGFSQAVGTLWEVDSADARRVASRFYTRVTADPSRSAALALHKSVREMRRTQPGAPHTWAAYVHSGA